jgi:predicted transcriptional regulator
MRIDEITPSYIKKLRNHLDYSTKEFSKEIGCSERFIAYRESGKRPIKKLFAYAVIGFMKTKGKTNER